MNTPDKSQHRPLPPPLTREQREAMLANVRRLRELREMPRPAKEPNS